MIIGSLKASCYIILVGLVAFLPQATSLEIVKFSLGVLSYAVKDQIGNVNLTVVTKQTEKESTTPRIVQQSAKIAEIKETFDPILEAQMTAAHPIGFFGKILGGASAKMIGAWSGSPTECATNRLIFFRDAHARATVAWWTQPLMLREGGLIPSLTGEWEVRDNAIVVSFDKATIGQPFTGGSVLTKPTHIRLKLEVVHDKNGKLVLGAPDGRLTLTTADLLDGANKKRFMRCVSLS